MGNRECSFTVVTGRKRIGKSNHTLELCLEYAQRRNVLIFDPNNEFGGYDLYYPDGSVKKIEIKRLDISQLDQFNRLKKPEIRRIVCLDKFGKPLDENQVENLLKRVLAEFNNGLLFLDDFNNIFADSLPKSVSRFLSNNAHRAADIILHLQSIARILPKMWQNTNLVRFHFQLDGVENSKQKLMESYELFKIAQNLVNKQYMSGNIRYFIYVDKDNGKLRGKFSPGMLIEAIQEYISQHTQCIKTLTDQRDIQTGKKKYTYNQAVELKTAELYNKYQGNK
jgi:hypothetical protein